MGTVTEREHARLSASNASRWLVCPGSISLGETCPPPPPSDWAEEGEHAHKLAEIFLRTKLMYEQTGNDAEVYVEAEDLVSDMYPHAIGYRDAVWEKVLLNTITGKSWGIEAKLTLNKQLSMYGYADFWATYTDERAKRAGAIVDLKYGYYHVDAKKNPQLAYYACALQKKYTAETGKPLDYVRVVIYQPRGDAEPYREAMLTAKQLEVWAKKFEAAAYKILVQQKTTLKTGKHCFFCPAKAICPKHAKEVEQESALALVEPGDTLPTVEALSPEQLSKIIIHGPRIEALISAARSHVLADILNGATYPGVKVVNSKPRRKWKDDTEWVKAKLKTLGIDEPMKVKETLRPITELQKYVARDELDYLTEYTTPKPQLAVASDERVSVGGPADLLNDETKGE